jgi:hypothetical protein
MGLLDTIKNNPITSAIGIGAAANLLDGGNNAPTATRLPPINYKDVLKGFSSPGLSAGYTGGRVNLTRSPGLTNTLTNIIDTSSALSSDIGSLLKDVTPGFGRLTQIATQEIENRRRKAIGNLRENLQRRRVAGSSFASDALARANAEFAQQQNKAQAEAFLQEIQLKDQLLKERANADLQALQTQLSQMNLEAGLAAQLQGSSNQLIADILKYNQAQAFRESEAARNQANIRQENRSSAIGNIAKLGTIAALL